MLAEPIHTDTTRPNKCTVPPTARHAKTTNEWGITAYFRVMA